MTSIKYTDNIIPIMTSNTTPAPYVASASSTYSSNRLPYNAFDRKFTGNDWESASGQKSGWISMNFGSKKRVAKYSITNTTSVSFSPKDWTFEGSHDGLTWDVLDRQSDINDWEPAEKKEYVVEEPKDYPIYRINVSEVNGATYINIAEIEMFEIDYYDKILISSSDGEVKSISNKILSDDLCVGGVAKASMATNSPDKAFNDKILTTGYIESWTTTTNSIPSWIEYDFANEEKVNLVNICSFYSGGYEAIKDFKILASKTGSFTGEEDILYIGVHPNDTTTDFVSYEFKNYEYYKYYRILISSLYTGNGGNNSSIAEIEMKRINSYLVSIDSDSLEQDFINYGMDDLSIIDPKSNYTKKEYHLSDNTVLGSGKTFEHVIDFNRYGIKKITMK